jgi:hypothetical protein
MDLLILFTGFIGLVLCIALLRKEMISGKPSSSVFSLSVVIVFLCCLVLASAANNERTPAPGLRATWLGGVVRILDLK